MLRRFIGRLKRDSTLVNSPLLSLYERNISGNPSVERSSINEIERHVLYLKSAKTKVRIKNCFSISVFLDTWSF
jgi:hypothetical protein